MDEQRLDAFLESVRLIDWLTHAGESCKNARVVENIQVGWDRDGKRMLKVWEPQTLALEGQAEGLLGAECIDHIFASVSRTIHESLYGGLCSYFCRTYGETGDKVKRLQESVDASLYPEVMDSIKRDVCWAGVESVLQANGLFTNLLDLYRRGRWPCSWDGKYPQGQPVVL